ncbi:hypothetical protein DSO57_1029115 [Entomophthora muscae]|uniref:Uncharacterized protein n=1 Tax=Entomophthora muscae TaxID=34485 RepID=A0ACC2SDV9_9FUNG|nr:hypothetical protein DSO57_1029115 [Entomophthora muscae]
MSEMKKVAKTPLPSATIASDEVLSLKDLLRKVDVREMRSLFSGLKVPLPSDIDHYYTSGESRQYMLAEIALNRVLLPDFNRKRALNVGQLDNNLPVNPHKFDSWGIRIQAPPLQTVKMMKFYAAAAYCKVERLVGWKCGENCDSLTKGSHVDGYLSNEKEKTAGYVALNHEAKLITLSYRGSSNMNNWFDNAQMILEPFTLAPISDAEKYGPLEIHKGFQSMTRSLLNQTIDTLSPLLEKYPNYHVAITGHSAGGAIAALTTAALGGNGLVPFNRMILTTFGQPRVGSPAFTSYLNSKPLFCARVTNGVDPVNVLPTQEMGFHHQHSEFFLSRVNGTDYVNVCEQATNAEDPDCARINALEKRARGHYEYFGTMNTECT